MALYVFALPPSPKSGARTGQVPFWGSQDAIDEIRVRTTADPCYLVGYLDPCLPASEGARLG